jgi:hypothetical protein
MAVSPELSQDAGVNNFLQIIYLVFIHMKITTPILKLKQPHMKSIHSITLLLTLTGFIACSKYSGKLVAPVANYDIPNEIVFENQYWESTGDSAVFSTDLEVFSNNLTPDDIISVSVKKQGYEIKAWYMDWGRNNLYKYELINNRVTVFWQKDELKEFALPPVTVVVKLK